MEERNERLKEIYLESGLRSVTAFAKLCRINQKTMDNYIKGLFKAGPDKLEMILEVFPQYSREWLMFGTGPKYNPDYVGDHFVNYNLEKPKMEEPETPKQTENSNALSDELRKSKDRLVARMIRRLTAAMQSNDLASIKDEIQGLILDLEDEQK